ncbi:hypothetical protein NFI96_006050 [Prochilodus magdalenae]|nr:hypothetical protein NFI96_006050 [Prochilodus magdalenae]
MVVLGQSGKCSHGGLGDLTSVVEPKGGINKDDPDASHGSLHFVAAEVATAATKELLQDIRNSTNATEFLRLMGIFQSSSVLCFVVDTSASMADEIAEVKRITSSIIDSRLGTVDKPSAYVLVPFNDPDFGPVRRTTDPDDFKKAVNALSAGGGGADDPEMSLSGLWLALAAAPVASEIFVFTDAEPKDTEMKSTVLALIESTKTTASTSLRALSCRILNYGKTVILTWNGCWVKLSCRSAFIQTLNVLSHAAQSEVLRGSRSSFRSSVSRVFFLYGITTFGVRSGVTPLVDSGTVAREDYVYDEHWGKDSDAPNSSLVNFMLTNPLTNTTRSLSNPVNQVYEDLAVASGGLAIEVPKELLANATSVVNDTSIASRVTIFQTVRDPGRAEGFAFIVDSSVKNLTFYITGNSTQFSIIAPSGQSQSSDQSDGSLAMIQTVVNFHMVRVKNSSQPGLWSINIDSVQPYTLKVTGKSVIDFQFDFVERFQNPHPGYTVFKSRPQASGNVTLLLSMLGTGSEVPAGVFLFDASGSGSYASGLEGVGNGDYLVTATTVPKGEFFVAVIGFTNSSSNDTIFQRQSSTRHRASNISVTAVRNGTWVPGQVFSLPFTVTTNSSGSTYTITARNSGLYNMTFPRSLTTGGDGVAGGTVKLTAPDNTAAGTEVVLTIEVTQPGSTDTNYAFLRLAVSGAVAPPAGLGLSLWLSAVALLCSTIGRRLHHAGLHAHRPLPRLSLTPRHRHQRLQWCRTRLSWSDSEWQRVIFSDESRFSLGGDAQRVRVWRHRGPLHLHPYRTICRNCVRMFKLHGMDYHRTPLGTSTAPYRDVWRVGLARTDPSIEISACSGLIAGILF